ncbi:epoxyqueuosine reductase QueG [Sporomusaceae bacterium BoRhaA]|uniref:4Fe-4S double cluster binding domain-containing protein n=1 Tax=Pelorhabdus rhamnosifermentans TaxID=2772457 RepID=UPI001C061F3B|nr:epoxyqueuosine reductase QueG [Pelorhabdus rhamnosifermentans]
MAYFFTWFLLENKCGTCHQCVSVCPVQAIKGRNSVEYELRSARLDVTKCMNYFAELDSLGKLQVCAMCVYACPRGKIS